MAHLRPVLPAVALISILWTIWDPTYATLQRARTQGRDVRVQGKHLYIVCMHIQDLRKKVLTSIRFSNYFHGHQEYLHLFFSLCLALDLTKIICIYRIIHRHLGVGFTFLHLLLLNYLSVLVLLICLLD